MKTIDRHKMALQILKAYNNNITTLPQTSIGHFFQRAYRVTGDHKYDELLIDIYRNTKIPVVKSGIKILQEHINNNVEIPFTGNHPRDNQRKRDRYTLYKQQPSLSFFDELLINLFYVDAAHLCQTNSRDICAEATALLQKIDFEKLYFNEDVILKDGSFMINSVFFLDHLKIRSNEKLYLKVVQFIKEYYLNDQLKLQKNLDQWEYHSFIYNLTHIIIAKSRFYEQSVDQHLWIIHFFAENIKEIIKRTKMDIISEVGLCIKLTNQQKRHATTMRIIQDHIMDHYDFEKMLSLDFLEKKEHNNSIIMLLFYNNEKWFPGPNLIQKYDSRNK